MPLKWARMTRNSLLQELGTMAWQNIWKSRGASETGGDRQEEKERQKLQKGQRSDQISHWLTTGREETQLQSRD